MWKPSKLTLLILILITSISGGITLSYVDWEAIKIGKKIFGELKLPIIFIILSLYFLFPYVKRLKEDKSE